MRTRTAAVALAVLLAPLPIPAAAQSLEGDVLHRFTLLRAAPGRLLELVAALKSAGLAATASKALLLRHSQGDHWDVMVLQPIGSYAAHLKESRPAPLAPASLIAWQEDGFVRGPELDQIAGFREGALFHAEMFHALGEKRAELVKEREMENAYLRGVGRPTNAIFVRELGASWDCFTLGSYRGWTHFAERDAIPKEKAAAAAKAAGFPSDDHVGPYLRSLILDHHDSLLTPVR
jgi:hypothetical protein